VARLKFKPGQIIPVLVLCYALSQNGTGRIGGYNLVVEYLPSMHEALDSIPTTIKKVWGWGTRSLCKFDENYKGAEFQK
jgi:hypothetical protein